jgi:hypothetical protein
MRDILSKFDSLTDKEVIKDENLRVDPTMQTGSAGVCYALYKYSLFLK